MSINYCAIVNADNVNLRVVYGINQELKVTRTIEKNTLVRVFNSPVYDYQVDGRNYEFLPITFDENTGLSNTPNFWIASDFLTRVACPSNVKTKTSSLLLLGIVSLFLLKK